MTDGFSGQRQRRRAALKARLRSGFPLLPALFCRRKSGAEDVDALAQDGPCVLVDNPCKMENLAMGFLANPAVYLGAGAVKLIARLVPGVFAQQAEQSLAQQRLG